MAQYELLLSELYETCAATWAKDKDFWLDIAHQEVQHAENIRMMQEIINKKPEHFESGRPINLIAINTAATGLKDIIKRLTAGEYTYEKILIIARDMESSVLEAHYPEIVKTKDLEYQTLMKITISDTSDHNKHIQQKLAEVKKKT